MMKNCKIIKIISYKHSRLCFKRDIIEPLDCNDIFEIKCHEGIFKMTKKQFYETFKNVTKTKSYRNRGVYHYPEIPRKALVYRIDLIADEISITKSAESQKDKVGDEIREAIKNIGLLWNKSHYKPKISKEIISAWERVIMEWKDCKELPLVIRKQNDFRGSELTHKTGRKVIITDNSFSQWVYYNVLHDQIYILSDIEQMLQNDKIPFSFAIAKVNKNSIKYKKNLGKYSINKLGWRLCHIENVGLNRRQPIEEIGIEILEDHFVKLANPKNMFIIPLAIQSLGELKEFIETQR